VQFFPMTDDSERRTVMTLRIALSAAAGALLCGCVSDADIASRSLIAPDSPVARAIAEARGASAAYPAFSDIPSAPADLPTAEDWRKSAGDIELARRSLAQGGTAPDGPGDTEAFVRDARARVGNETAPEDSTAAALAFIRESQQRATPPPAPR